MCQCPFLCSSTTSSLSLCGFQRLAYEREYLDRNWLLAAGDGMLVVYARRRNPPHDSCRREARLASQMWPRCEPSYNQHPDHRDSLDLHCGYLASPRRPPQPKMTASREHPHLAISASETLPAPVSILAFCRADTSLCCVRFQAD